MKIDPRFLKTIGIEAFTGNELLVKGALEAGVGLITGYPGSPVSDVFDVLTAIAPYLAERGVVAQIANNEALATARLNGARQAGLRAMAVMKSVGLHVGADALAIGNLMETRKRQGGAFIVVGDDPWNETTQINSDSRHLSRHLQMPILEPSTFQEIKDWIAHACDLSGASDLYITYLITTNQADGGATVEVRPHPEVPINRNAPTTLSSHSLSIPDSVLIPPHTSMREATLGERFARLLKRSRELGINKLLGPQEGRFPLGFIASGTSYSYLEEVLRLLGLWEDVPVLKIGLSYPLDKEEINSLAQKVEHIIVVEEKRGFLESQVGELLIELLQEGRLAKAPALWGKKFPNEQPGFPSVRGLNVSIVLEVLGPLILQWKKHFPKLEEERVQKEIAEIVHTRSSSYDVPLRTPTFCPGCPHRDSATVSLRMKEEFLKKEEPSDVIFHGESGCHSMLQFAPNEGLMQNYSGMGLGGGTGAGMAPFVKNKQVVFLGDSTFFHSGMIAVSDSIKNNQDITYIILDNKTTAMTGHQPTPANDVDVMGFATNVQDIERVLKGMAPQGLFIQKVNPAERDAYAKILEDTVLMPGVKVLIADKECAITFHRRENARKKETIKIQGYLAREEKINISPEVCENCLECTRQTGCPGLTIEETAYGPKITTDLSTCVDDGACARTKACPSFEKVVITRQAAPKKNPAAAFDFDSLPAPRIETFEDRWTAYTAGVGGMGAGVVNAVLVRAGMREGYQVSFLDKKGLAIRNGGVYGHIVFSRDEPVHSPVIPYGKADLLVGLDLLEAARGLDARTNLRVAHPARTNAVINTHRHHTVLSLMGLNNIDPDKLEKAIQSKVRLGGFVSGDFSEISEDVLGSKLYVNMMILGAAYQKGWIPVTEPNLLKAISESVRRVDEAANHQAFRLGRFLVMNPNRLKPPHESQPWDEVLKEKEKYLRPRVARRYRRLVEEAVRWMDISGESKALLARTIYDLIRYDGALLAERYIEFVWRTYRRDRKEFGLKATKTVILELFRVLAIKDEVWVAHLLTSPEKYERDNKRFHIDPSRGDKLRYVHLNRPQFVVAGRVFEFDLKTRDWMLRLMKHARFLRWLLPSWHKKEKDFRDWYIQLVQRFTYFESAQDYELYANALATASIVKGYREVRYARMEEATQKAQEYLSQIGTGKAERRFQPFEKPL